MKKVGIITLNGNNNYGNKLQNYALIHTINKLGYDANTIWFKDEYSRIKIFIKKIMFWNKTYKREVLFEKYTKKYLNRKFFKPNYTNMYNNFIVGSDQVWNYTFHGVRKNLDKYFLTFSPKEKNISYAASLGVKKIDEEFIDIYNKNINNFKNISVREDDAKIVLEKITNRKDIVTTLDPTMLLTKNEWKKMIKKPKNYNNKEYILIYFLGNLSDEVMNKIEKYSNNNNLEIINILDENNKYYITDPNEFLFLINKANLIITDSFHASVFSIIFNKPFLVMDRKQKNVKSMSSRIDTLLNKLLIEDRRYSNNKDIESYIEYDYKKSYIILNNLREESIKYLKESLKK